MTIITSGFNLAKNIFAVHGVDETGAQHSLSRAFDHLVDSALYRLALANDQTSLV